MIHKTCTLVLLLAAGCLDNGPTPERSLSIAMSPDHLEIGNGDIDALLAWSSTEATLSCGGETAPFARITDGVWHPDTEQTQFASCAALLVEAEAALRADGIALPWRAAAAPVASFSACEIVKTWVFGGSCGACKEEAIRSSSVQGDVTTKDSSCNQGAVTTECTHTICNGDGQEMAAMSVSAW